MSWYLGENLEDYPNIFDFGRLFTGIHLAGPELTPENLRDGLFSYNPTGGYTTAFGLVLRRHPLAVARLRRLRRRHPDLVGRRGHRATTRPGPRAPACTAT